MTQHNNPAAGGRGKRAPYNTIHYRIPHAIKSSVEKISKAYKALVSDYDNPYDQRLIEEAEGAISISEVLQIEALLVELAMVKEQNLEISNRLAAAEESAGNLDLSNEEKKLLDRILRQSLKLKANSEEETKQHIREVITKVNRE